MDKTNNISAIRCAISIVPLLLIFARLVNPNLKIDDTTLYLLAIALIPWLGFLIKTLELPGGIKIETKALEEAAVKAGLLPSVQPMSFVQKAQAYLPAKVTSKQEMVRKGFELIDAIRQTAIKNNINVGEDLKSSIDELAKKLPDEIMDSQKKEVVKEVLTFIDQALDGRPVNQGAFHIVNIIATHLVDSLKQSKAADT